MPPDLRPALLDQLGYLLDEVACLEKLLTGLPGEVLEARPAGKWSIKETLGHLADSDRDVFLPRLRRMAGEDEPAFENIDQDALVARHRWNERPVLDVLASLRDARRDLVAFLETLPPEHWSRTGLFPDGTRHDAYSLAHHIIQHGAHHLKTLAYRLHETRLPGPLTGFPE